MIILNVTLSDNHKVTLSDIPKTDMSDMVGVYPKSDMSDTPPERCLTRLEGSNLRTPRPAHT
jgi:hypothetical protein